MRSSASIMPLSAIACLVTTARRSPIPAMASKRPSCPPPVLSHALWLSSRPLHSIIESTLTTPSACGLALMQANPFPWKVDCLVRPSIQPSVSARGPGLSRSLPPMSSASSPLAKASSSSIVVALASKAFWVQSVYMKCNGEVSVCRAGVCALHLRERALNTHYPCQCDARLLPIVRNKENGMAETPAFMRKGDFFQRMDEISQSPRDAQCVPCRP